MIAKKSSTIFIVDPDVRSIDSLRYALDEVPFEVKNIFPFYKCEAAIEAIPAIRPDLVFLDGNLPMLSEVLASDTALEETRTIVTVDKASADEVSKHQVPYSCLYKPYDTHALEEILRDSITEDDLVSPNSDVDKSCDYNRVAIPMRNGFAFIKENTILKGEASGAATKLYLTDGRMIEVSQPMKHVLKLLPAGKFIRTHQSHLVNTGHVTHYLKNKEERLTLSDGSTVPVSRRQKQAINAHIASLMSMHRCTHD